MFEKKKAKKPKYDINWYSDKYQSVVVTRDRLLLVTLLAILAMGAMTFAMYYFVPLKTVKPFVIQIDENTGIAKVAKSENLNRYKANEELVKYFAMKYIYARESYDFRTFDSDREIVEVLSAGDVRGIYRTSINPKNMASPVLRFGNQTQRSVRLNSFTFLEGKSERTIQARLEVTEVSVNRFPNVYPVQVTMTTTFEPEYIKRLSGSQRLINPLGFLVLSYRVDDYKI